MYPLFNKNPIIIKPIIKKPVCYFIPTLAQMVKYLPAMQETQVQSPGRKDPLEKGMATHCGIFAWRIPWKEEPRVLQYMRSKESDTTEQLTLLFSLTNNKTESLLIQLIILWNWNLNSLLPDCIS